MPSRRNGRRIRVGSLAVFVERISDVEVNPFGAVRRKPGARSSMCSGEPTVSVKVGLRGDAHGVVFEVELVLFAARSRGAT